MMKQVQKSAESDVQQRNEPIKYKGPFEMWGTDACRNYEYCGGRISLFVANKKCISCDPISYERQPEKSYADGIAEGRRLEKERIVDGLRKTFHLEGTGVYEWMENEGVKDDAGTL